MTTTVPDSLRKIPCDDYIGFSTRAKKDKETGDEYQEFATATSLTGPRERTGVFYRNSKQWQKYDVEDATKQYADFNINEYLSCWRWTNWATCMAQDAGSNTYTLFAFAQTGKLLEKLNHRMIVLENDNALLHDRITALEKRNNQLETELNLQTIVNDTTIASDPIESSDDDTSDSNSDSSSGSECDSDDDDARETEQQLQPNKCKME